MSKRTKVINIENPLTRRLYTITVESKTPSQEHLFHESSAHEEVPRCMGKSKFDFFKRERVLRPMREVLGEVRI